MVCLVDEGCGMNQHIGLASTVMHGTLRPLPPHHGDSSQHPIRHSAHTENLFDFVRLCPLLSLVSPTPTRAFLKTSAHRSVAAGLRP
jgi:hypothetical protein